MHVEAYWFLLSNIPEQRLSHTRRMVKKTLLTALCIHNSRSGWQEIWNTGANSRLSLILSCWQGFPLWFSDAKKNYEWMRSEHVPPFTPAWDGLLTDQLFDWGDMQNHTSTTYSRKADWKSPTICQASPWCPKIGNTRVIQQTRWAPVRCPSPLPLAGKLPFKQPITLPLETRWPNPIAYCTQVLDSTFPKPCLGIVSG